MTMYTPIPDVVSGRSWSRDNAQEWLVDNLNYLFSQLGGGGQTLAINEVVIAATGGGLAGVALGDQELLIGTSGAPIAVAAGAGYLRSVNGVIGYGQPDVTINLADIFKYT